MKNYIKYQRFVEHLNGNEEIQKFLDKLIIEGWDILHYSESIKSTSVLEIIALCGKKQIDISGNSMQIL